ncbi:glycerol-3-phosphate-acyltransferase [Lentinula lateritia]|uniref:Glycerol-3-phosphate-acyltransferase n=1 Tax=Lentinula aff. lateritia TaxID=2804960 RepID=A0ACC1U1E3_9AGAR|nr:glycerol-3-phosphate-acyltransferase [Lentinula aff. lateritia]KAJ3851072.1 glycerol-3-phosphate-acyltransferase [Lentinula lateritia]
MSSLANDFNFFLLHRLIRYVTGLAAVSFFSEIRVVGGENVPQTGPIIITATHHNMMLDPVILSSTFPNQRILHYWSKASLFANPVIRQILLSTGNIPVDRKSNDRRVLFRGTFEALSKGYAVALFPEGTSYTEPRIMQIKDGAAWAALEYTKYAKEHPGTQEVKVVPVAIVYTNKSKYRSSVIIEFGQPISIDPYKEQFFSDIEGTSRAAAKRLSHDIETELTKHTVNAPDWDTLYAARMARDILWQKDNSINLDDFVAISQTLVDLFSTVDVTPKFNSTRLRLLEYYSLLQTTNLTNSILSTLPLPRDLDPHKPVALPSRLLTLLLFVRDTCSSLVHLPFFLFPLVVHMPVYIMGRFGAHLVEDEEETQAQNKVAFGLFSLFLIYPAAFFFLWALFWYTPVGAIIAATTVYMFAIYHNRTITGNYEAARRFITAWRILIGVWAPKKWDLSVTALSLYTTPKTPKENPWVEKPKTNPISTPSISSDDNSNINVSSSEACTPSGTTLNSMNHISSVLPPDPTLILPREQEPLPTVKTYSHPHSRRRPPTRRIMRHVLRARIEAVKALAVFFNQLEHTGERRKLKVRASSHLAETYGGLDGRSHVFDPSLSVVESKVQTDVQGWRYATEVVTFLRKRGAKIPSVNGGGVKEDMEDWALTSDAEGESVTSLDDSP